jgi:hypothetical protein
MKPRTIIEKIWDSHVVSQQPGAPALMYVDLHLVHEVTSPQAFDGLRKRGLKVRRPDLTIATTDHSTPTTPRGLPIIDKIAATQVAQLETNCRDFGVRCYGLESERQGIVHVMGPEQGLTQPGMTVVCGDSHTATHGAFGALAFGIGARAGHAVPPAASFEDLCRPRRWHPEKRRHGEGHHSQPALKNRHRRRDGMRDRIFRFLHPRAIDRRADDGLQHVY